MSVPQRSLVGAATRPLPQSRTARRLLAVLGFAATTALAAKLSVPLPGTPVPFTLQPLVVLLAGALPGSRPGAASQAAYLLAGAVGLPVFAAGGGLAYLFGPTGGYLLAYPAAAFLVGELGGEGRLRTLGALLAGLAAIYAGGLAWLALVGTFDAAVAMGLRPFLLADLVKVAQAYYVVRLVRGPAARLLR